MRVELRAGGKKGLAWQHQRCVCVGECVGVLARWCVCAGRDEGPGEQWAGGGVVEMCGLLLQGLHCSSSARQWESP